MLTALSSSISFSDLSIINFPHLSSYFSFIYYRSSFANFYPFSHVYFLQNRIKRKFFNQPNKFQSINVQPIGKFKKYKSLIQKLFFLPNEVPKKNSSLGKDHYFHFSSSFEIKKICFRSAFQENIFVFETAP